MDIKKKDLFWEGRKEKEKEKEKERSIYTFSKSFLELDEATKVLGWQVKSKAST